MNISFDIALRIYSTFFLNLGKYNKVLNSYVW